MWYNNLKIISETFRLSGPIAKSLSLFCRRSDEISLVFLPVLRPRPLPFYIAPIDYVIRYKYIFKFKITSYADVAFCRKTFAAVCWSVVCSWRRCGAVRKTRPGNGKPPWRMHRKTANTKTISPALKITSKSDRKLDIYIFFLFYFYDTRHLSEN